MENINSAGNIDRFFSPGSRQLVREIFERERENEHLSLFERNLGKGKEGIKKILEYGVDRLPGMPPDNTDDKLADYFFLVSELSGLDDDVRSFSIDVSELCRGMYEHDSWYQNFDPRITYEEKIKPRLE